MDRMAKKKSPAERVSGASARMPATNRHPSTMKCPTGSDSKCFRSWIPKGLFSRIPVHPYMLMFHLELHHHVWVHVEDMDALCLSAGPQAKADPAAGADRSDRYPHRRDGRADG